MGFSPRPVHQCGTSLTLPPLLQWATDATQTYGVPDVEVHGVTLLEATDTAFLGDEARYYRTNAGSMKAQSNNFGCDVCPKRFSRACDLR